MLAPDSVAVPAPVLVTPPLPASTALTSPPDRANVPEEDSVPALIKRPTGSRCFCVWLVPPRSSVPPDTVVDPEVLPNVPLPESCRVPALTVVPPV